MKFKIGLDFDNTLVTYDALFHKLAQEKNWINAQVLASKKSIKEFLINKDGNDYRWQELQAEAYGPRINEARLFDGALEFIKQVKRAGHEIFIVSHKTETSNYLPEVKLQEPALNFMKANKIIGRELIPRENIYFAPTRKDKIEKIKSLDLHVFIDDLEKVFDEANFEKGLIKVLFSSDEKKSKKYITTINWKENLKLIQDIVVWNSYKTELPKEIIPLKRDGNNRIFLITDQNNKRFVLKSYYRHSMDERDRGNCEFKALSLMWKHGMQHIPRPLYYDQDHQTAIYSYCDGSMVKGLDKNGIKAIADFISGLQKIYRGMHDKSELWIGADSRNCLQDYIDTIDRRIKNIRSGSKENELLAQVREFLEEEVLPVKNKIYEKFYQSVESSKLYLSKSFDDSEKTLSPSDYGPHNMLIDDKGIVNFIDFEYFGVDDPAKMLADFFHHVAFDISRDHKWLLYDLYLVGTNHKQLEKRFDLVIDLVGLEWVLIVLNIASPGQLQRRKLANSTNEAQRLVSERLRKAAKMIQNIVPYRKKDYEC